MSAVRSSSEWLTPTAHVRFARRAMATQFEVIVPWGTPQAADAAAEALDLIDRLEAQLSVFRCTSEISRLNRTAAHAPVPLEPRLYQLLIQARQIHSETDGAFDITTGPLIRAWGFHNRAGQIPDDAALEAARANVGMNLLAFDDERRSVRFARSGVEINLGSIGKGYALDGAAKVLAGRLESALLQGGASSILAMGDEPWTVGVRHPSQARRLARVHLRDRALAITGSSQQHFVTGGRTYGHVLDPRTGQPAHGMALAAAIAPTAAEADALSTALYVLGVDGTQRYCERHPECAAILLSNDADATPLAVNLPARDFDWDDSPIFDLD